MSEGTLELAAGTCHPTAIVDPEAELHESVTIGPYSIVGPHVALGEDVRIDSHVLIERDTQVGDGCRIHKGAVLGTDPQDLKYDGQRTWLEIGERTTVREYATINRGTEAAGRTVVGSDCLIMAYAHVAHDCRLGNHVILSNAVNMGGHVEIGDWAIVGGLVAIHQFVRIGPHAFVGGGSRLPQDVVPYTMVAGNPCEAYGLNLVGLRRRGFEKETLHALRTAYRTIFQSDRNIGGALEEIEDSEDLAPEVLEVVEFIRDSERGVTS